MSTLALDVWPLEGPLTGSVPVVADAEIVERTLLFAALASGTSRLTVPHPPRGLEECLDALQALGVSYAREADEVLVSGRGLRGLRAPEAPIDASLSPVFWLGLLGALSGQGLDASLIQHDPGEVESAVECLRSRGANVTVEADAVRVSAPAGALHGGAFSLTPAQAALKHVLLVSGLYAQASTTVREAWVSADHSERGLQAIGCPVTTLGPVVHLEPGAGEQTIPEFGARIPASPSAAAYLQALAAATRMSHVVVRDVSLNPTRSSFLELLRTYGAEVGISPRWESLGEAAGEVSVKANKVAPLSVGGELALRLDHEFYALVYLSTRAQGTSEFSALPAWLTSTDVGRIIGYLRSFGVRAEGSESGFWVEGKGERPLSATRVTTGGDPRLAVLGSMLALSADSKSVIDDVESVTVLFPKLVGTLRALGARLEVAQ